MKTSFSYNLLQHLQRKKAEGGFTLIELLVVIIIIGILAAIALPSFLNQANRARESEAANYVGAANRAQQAYYLEFLEFTDDLANLDVGIENQTDNYAYGNATTFTATAGNGKFVEKDISGDPIAVLYAAPKDGLRGFAGVAYVQNERTAANLCREKKPKANDAQTATNEAIACNTANYDSL